jgi:hypothetical protein
MYGTLSGRAVPSHSRQRPLAQLSMRFLLLESFSVCTADCACACRRALVLRLLSTLHCPWPLDQLAAADTSLKHPSLLPYILVAPASRRRSFTFRLASSLLHISPGLVAPYSPTHSPHPHLAGANHQSPTISP